MSEHTSFRIGGPCDLLIMPGSIEDAVKAWVSCRENGVPCHVIGNGTNLLVRDGGIRGCLIKMAPGSEGIEKSGDASIQVKAGTLLPRLVQAALLQDLSGLEWAIGIPGSVGGAVTMNAGAYGGDFGSLVTRVQVAEADGRIHWIDSADIGFSYRHSLFSGRDDLLILSVELRLSPGDRNIIYDVMRNRAKEREEKQPLNMPSAGSAFRRPQGHYVGAMIESLGLKGAKVGGAQVSTKHAGFIVNAGGATAKDVESLIDLIRAKVKEGFDVDLQPEIVIMGER
jgi:UDP-N-acetylmuramate dehydrogenase